MSSCSAAAAAAARFFQLLLGLCHALLCSGAVGLL
jgi:hypothetical protein